MNLIYFEAKSIKIVEVEILCLWSQDQMGDAGFYRGTTSEQDGRFTDKEKKLLKTMKFEETLDQKVRLCISSSVSK